MRVQLGQTGNEGDPCSLVCSAVHMVHQYQTGNRFGETLTSGY